MNRRSRKSQKIIAWSRLGAVRTISMSSLSGTCRMKRVKRVQVVLQARVVLLVVIKLRRKKMKCLQRQRNCSVRAKCQNQRTNRRWK